MEERTRFVVLANSERYQIKELCEQFGISRKTGYKWLKRYGELGIKGLEQRSRAPKSCPQRTEQSIERLIVKERRLKKTWGAKKLRKILEVKYGVEQPPAMSTIGEILRRNGLITKRRRRPGVYKVERKELTKAKYANHVWAVDYKGWFVTKDGRRCDPLTVSDLYSRYVIGLKIVREATQRRTRKKFEGIFHKYGLPEIIRVDNGAPFASVGIARLSKLSVWWIMNGIEVEFIRPGKPQENGIHERMHRTLKAETLNPVSTNPWAQQRRFERWRKCYNQQRPHEGIGMGFPVDRYQVSKRRVFGGDKIELYKVGEQVRCLSKSGFLCWEGQSWFIGEALAGAEVALRSVDNSDDYEVWFANIALGIINKEGTSQQLRPPVSVTEKKWVEYSD